MTTLITKNQTKTEVKQFSENGKDYLIKLSIRYDDRCGNGHNTFAITGDIFQILKNGKMRDEIGGCIHGKIKRHFPEYAYLIKWHLCSSDEPMHYIANSLYHAKKISVHQNKFFVRMTDENTGIKNKMLGIFTSEQIELVKRDYPTATFAIKEYFNSLAKDENIDSARKCAIWPEAQLEDFTEQKLKNRLPELMREFRTDIENLGFTF